MAFPSTIDSFNTPLTTSKLNNPSHAGLHVATNTAVLAVEAKLGVDGSAVTTSLDYKIATGWVAAGETWTYASASSPEYTFTISGDKTAKYFAGMKIQYVQSATTKYALITKVAFSIGTTTVTIYGGTDYTLANAAITSPFYSIGRAPAGFPLDAAKWTVTVTDTSSRSQSSPVSGTWYNPGSLSLIIPTGIWNVTKHMAVGVVNGAGTQGVGYSTLSTGATTESFPETSSASYNGTLSNETIISHFNIVKFTLPTATQYFLNIKTTAAVTSIAIRGDTVGTFVRATSAYL